MQNDFIVIDTETTGLSHYRDEIVEVCAIKFNSKGEKIDEFYRLCFPLSGVIPVEASNIHGITIDVVDDQKSYVR